MILQDLHTHTTFCDGKNTPEEMVTAAIAEGLSRIGFSGHSYTAFDVSYCMTDYGAYIAEVRALAAKYAGKIEVLCGVEQDYYSDAPTADFDYVIGSVHYIRAGGGYIPVDESAKILKNAADKFFGGDIYALIGSYYNTLADVFNRTHCDIIGHFDLVSKFNEGGALFDESSPRYIAAYRRAADALADCGARFEINTGAIARGYRSVPYPSAEIIAYLKSRGAEFILSGDAHSTDGICFEFDKWCAFSE